jgi:quercetin dioxygenase-like cupin family protein
MHSATTTAPPYRNGDWGPAYLIQGPSSDIGVLRLLPGQAMPNHYHAHCDESFVVLEGRASVWVDAATRVELGPGAIVRCEVGELHYLVNDSDADFRCVFIKSPASPGDTVNVPWTPGDPAPARPTDTPA